VVNVTVPLLNPPLPSVLEPSKKETVPAGVPAEEVTVAVNVIADPRLADAADVEIVVVVAVSVWTTSVTGLDVAPTKFVSPLYRVVMECDPSARATVRVATFPLRVTGAPSAVPPSLNVTVPVGMDVPLPVTVAVRVMVCPAMAGFGFAVRVTAEGTAGTTVKAMAVTGPVAVCPIFVVAIRPSAAKV
jgi:hypothetical protein